MSSDLSVRGDLSAEDAKLVRLARAARMRAHTPHGAVAEGAAVRDVDGRTYAGATVDSASPELVTSALRVAVVTAAASGARSFESAALVTDAPVADADAAGLALLAEFGTGIPVLVADPAGTVRRALST
ncbi:MAG: cytidine deaminase [Frankiaceae bacterium]